ncbi:MAG: ammonium transporter [Myxococcales bacterium]|nr:ammonium transporter [Myxococcales bacterium]
MPADAVPPGRIDTGDTAWMLTASALVLLMTPGLSFFYGGMVRPKNILSTMLQSFLAMGLVSLLWVVVGFSLAFGESIGGVVGDPRTYFLLRGVGGAPHEALSPTVPLAVFALFQLKFAIITPALVTGSFAERVRFSAYLVFIVAFTLLIYCPLAHSTWHPDGFLRKMGVLDFAGGTVVHMSAGFAALAGALVLGRRTDYLRGQNHQPAHIPYVLLGTGMLWFGWFGFNAGSALAASATAVHAFLTTNTASAAAMLAWLLFDGLRGIKPSAIGACIGAVVGLVAVTPAAGYVTVGGSMLIGVVAAVACNVAVRVKARTGLDDTLDVFPCHGVGGIVGMLLTAVLATRTVNPAGADGLLYGGHALFLTHLVALALVTAFAFGGSYALFRTIATFMRLRVTAEQEALGLDVSQHGETANPVDPDARATTVGNVGLA